MSNKLNESLTLGSNDRPPVLFPGEFQQWKSRFDHYIITKGEMADFINASFAEGPKEFKHPDTQVVLKPYQLTGDDAKRAQADIDSKSIIIQALPNELYKIVDSFKSRKEILDEIIRQQEGYEMSDTTKMNNALALYEDFEQGAEEDLNSCYKRFNEVINETRKVGLVKDNPEINMKFLKKLNADWMPYGENLAATKNTKKMNIHEMVGKLMHHNTRVMKLQTERNASNAIVTPDPLALIA